MFPRLPALGVLPFSARFLMSKTPLRAAVTTWVLALLLACLVSCSAKPDPHTLVMIIESSPTNLDPRVGLDGQSERIDELIFDALLTRDEHFNVQPGLADRWEIPDPLNLHFSLASRREISQWKSADLARCEVDFRFAASRENSQRQVRGLQVRRSSGSSGRIHRSVSSQGTGRPSALESFRGRNRDCSLWQRKRGQHTSHWIGCIQICERSNGQRSHHRAQRQLLGSEAPCAASSIHGRTGSNTRALELRKGSADIAISALTADTVLTLEHESHLEVLRGPGTIVAYLAFNLRDPILKDVRVRQAIACAIDRTPMIQYLMRDFARPAYSLLPAGSWAYNGDVPTLRFQSRARPAITRSSWVSRGGWRSFSY